jgi:hypothetical protein
MDRSDQKTTMIAKTRSSAPARIRDTIERREDP